jgi:Ala-tRNA(Pro) deacylase
MEWCGAEMTTSLSGSVPDAVAETHERLLGLLERAGARYRLMRHPAEGRTEQASLLRGHHLGQAAKCMVVRVKISKKIARYVLAVVPGDRRVDVGSVGCMLDGRSASLAPKSVAERLAGAVSGCIPPFSFHPELQLVVDPELLDHEEIFFNAARLDCSVALATEDYVSIAGGDVGLVLHPLCERRSAM